MHRGEKKNLKIWKNREKEKNEPEQKKIVILQNFNREKQLLLYGRYISYGIFVIF